MRIRHLSRSEPPARTRGCIQLDCHVQAYLGYLIERGNATGYVRNCEATAVHLSMWMRQASNRLADVDETLVSEFLERHLPRCSCTTSAHHPASVRAALGHRLVVLRAAGAIGPKPPDETAGRGTALRLQVQGTDIEMCRPLAPPRNPGTTDPRHRQHACQYCPGLHQYGAPSCC